MKQSKKTQKQTYTFFFFKLFEYNFRLGNIVISKDEMLFLALPAGGARSWNPVQLVVG